MIEKNVIFANATAFLLAAGAASANPALTIYNENFAVVRDAIHLDLKPGVNDISYTEATMHLEPDSVVLRDPKGAHELQILEQNFRADPISQGLLLNYYEGKTIDFEVSEYENGQARKRIVRGKIVRSGYVPHQGAYQQYGWQYAQAQMAYSSPDAGAGQPIIEVDGKLMFRLPGEPLFPSLPNDSILKPTLNWQLNAAEGGPVEAELSYVTGGMSWHADYNVVAPEKGDTLDLVGWVTMDNQSGKTFRKAKIKLMAGDVNKLQPNLFQGALGEIDRGTFALKDNTVSEKAFDEYHLYTLERPATLLDRETKQVEFVRAAGIKSRVLYVYDGAEIDKNRYNGWNWESIRNDRDYGTLSNPKVWVMREFSNAESNHLGMPLPKGRVRFYRSDADGQMEFTGENTIGHTPRDEVIRVATGNAFDVVGERKRTNFKVDNNAHWMEESFEIKLRNHKKESAEIRVVEHLYRWENWEIREKSDDFIKTDSQTMEFRVTVAPDAEKTVTYTVHYTW
jgi:hypothetical protein